MADADAVSGGPPLPAIHLAPLPPHAAPSLLVPQPPSPRPGSGAGEVVLAGVAQGSDGRSGGGQLPGRRRGWVELGAVGGTPIQRVLLVAIVAAATADVNKCRRTSVLRRPPLQSKVGMGSCLKV